MDCAHGGRTDILTITFLVAALSSVITALRVKRFSVVIAIVGQQVRCSITTLHFSQFNSGLYEASRVASSPISGDPLSTVTVLDAGRLVIRITVARDGTSDLPASLAVRTVTPFRYRPLRLTGVVHGIVRILVDDVVELKDLRLLGGKTVNYRDAVLLVQANIIERRILVVGIHDQWHLRGAAQW